MNSVTSTPTLAMQYRQRLLAKISLLVAMTVALFLSVLWDLSTGPSAIAMSDLWHTLISPSSVDQRMALIVWDIRMPIALMAVVVGACLSLAGAQMQTVLNNPMASPFSLGLSAAASFGAALAMAFGFALIPLFGDYVVATNAFVMAMLCATAIHFISQKRGVSTETIILLGIALVFTFNALLALIQYYASEQAVSAVVFWTMGSLTKATWGKLGICFAVLLIALPFFVRATWSLTTLRMGDDKARSFGVNVGRLRLQTLVFVSLLAAIPVAFVGTIGFVGLVGPHIARMLIGEDQRFFIPASILCGALLLSLSSVVSKLLITGAIFPIGIVTSLVGVPFFIWLIVTRGSKR